MVASGLPADSHPGASGTGGVDLMTFPFAGYRDLIESFASARQAGCPPVPSGQDGLEVQRLTTAMERSSATDGRVAGQR